jgi:hypothetical protein
MPDFVPSPSVHNRNAYCSAQLICSLVVVVRGRLVVLRLVKEEVSSQFFVLVAGKIGLDGLISIES